MSSIISPNMGLTIPGVGTEPGPDWASELNASLTLIDQHNHSPGYGVQINPDGLNINIDLSMQSNNLTLARSIRLDPQAMPIAGATDLGCIYESGVDLYYNDGNGNQVRITQSGAVAGTPGSIANLVSPASATYVPATPAFVWQSDADTPANMDAGAYIFRNLVANSKALTLSPPNSMAANYSLTLPQLPASQKFMTLDAAGTMSASWAVDDSSIEVNSNTVRVKAHGVTQTMLGNANFTLSSSCGVVNVTGTSYAAVTNLSGSLTSTGRPVRVELVPAGGTFSVINNGAGTFFIALYRDGSQVSEFFCAGASSFWLPNPLGVDDVAAGTYAYEVRAKVTSGTLIIANYKLRIQEA